MKLSQTLAAEWDGGWRRALILLGLALLAGCNDSSTSGPTDTDEVRPPTLQSISIRGELQLEEGSQSQLTVTATYSDGRNQDVTSRATYRSSNDAVATVSSSGLVTGVRTGDAVITASYQEGGVSRDGNADVTVLREIPEYQVTLSVSSIRILEDCDPGPFIQTGPGEFTYRVMTEFPGDGGDIVLTESGSRVSRDAGTSIAINRSRDESFRGDSADVQISYRLTEWDDNTADRNMNNRLGSRVHSLRNGQWTGTGSNEITIGPSGCRAQLRYTFSAARTN